MGDFQNCFELLKAGDVDSLRSVLERDPGASEARDAMGVTLLMQCLYRGRREMAELMAGKKKALDIFEAAGLGRVDWLKTCLDDLPTSDGSIDSLSKDGFTALHFACFFGQVEAARLLLKHGAAVDVVAANATRVMPLHSAASARNLEAARLLLERGAPVNARQQGGWVPIHAAAQNGDRGMVELLLGHGADSSVVNDAGKTAAEVAREKGHAEIAGLLERARADLRR
jgi:ankyrin repeat protein